MANIFADIGRSNVAQVGQGIFRDVLAVGQQERQGLVDAVTMKHQEDQMALAQKKAAREEEAYQRDSEILFSNDIAAQGEKAGKANISNHVLEQAKALGLAKEIKTPDGKVMYGYARRDLKEV